VKTSRTFQSDDGRPKWVPAFIALALIAGIVGFLQYNNRQAVAASPVLEDVGTHADPDLKHTPATIEEGEPNLASRGWTQESTNTVDVGPWLDYSPPGTRYYRDANRMIYRVYPPGVKPSAEPANPFGLNSSTTTVPN